MGGDNIQIPLDVAVQVPIRRIVIDRNRRDQANGLIDRRRQHRAVNAGALELASMVVGRAQPGARLCDHGGAAGRLGNQFLPKA
jgi:hypothetical protein